MDAFFTWLSSNPVATTTLIVLFAVVVVAAIVVYLVALFQGREVSFWPPRIGAKPERELESSTLGAKKNDVLSAAKTRQMGGKATLSPPPQRSSLPQIFSTDPLLAHFVPSLSATRFKTVDLPQSVTPKTFGSAYAPTGLVVIYDIPFLLQPDLNPTTQRIEHRIIDVQPSLENVPKIELISAQVEGVVKVHILLSAGHGYKAFLGVQFLDKSVGYIELVFADNTMQRAHLILGKNIREWAVGNQGDLVREIDHDFAKPVWIAQDRSCLLDLMTVDVTEGPKSLSAIRVVGEFEEKHFGLMTPAIRISAITCERSQ